MESHCDKILDVNVHVCSPEIPKNSAYWTIYIPGIGTHSVIVSSPLGQWFPAAIFKHYNSAFFIPLDTHQRLVDRGSMEWGLPRTSKHSQQWESNPRHIDLESNTLSAQPHAPLSYSKLPSVYMWVRLWLLIVIVFIIDLYLFLWLQLRQHARQSVSRVRIIHYVSR